MTAAEIVAELERMGTAPIRKVLLNHGAQEPLFGARIGDMKPLQKRIKKDYELAVTLYGTGIYDVQYFAGLIADEAKMTQDDLRGWLEKSNCPAIAVSVVAALAAESRHGRELALEWMESDEETTARVGWATLGFLVALRDDAELDTAELERLLQRVERTIHQEPNDVRYSMNSFVISLGSYVQALTQRAIEAGESVGPVTVDMGDTACKVPYAPDYIRKVQARGAIGKKRKTARC